MNYFMVGNLSGAMESLSILRGLDPKMASSLEKFISDGLKRRK